MCELLGLAFNKPISPSLSFRGFRHRGERNPDGWGLAAIARTKARFKRSVRFVATATTMKNSPSNNMRDS